MPPSPTIPGFDATRSRHAVVARGGWDGHQPVEATDLFIPHLREHGFTVDVHEGPEPYADAELMARTDLIVQSVTMSTIEQDQLAGLIAAVTSGTGFAGWHGGIADSFRNSSDYLHLIGGQFGAHPGKAESERVGQASDNDVPHSYQVTDLGRAHPIMAGIGDFELTTEQYWVLADHYIDTLATTTQQMRSWDPWHREVTSPAIWTRQWGEGRIFVSTPGHRVEVLQDPTVNAVIKRGLLWASR